MPFRKTLFWFHLSCGILAGIVIFIMSLTGVLLAFQHQIVDFADRRAMAPFQVPNGAALLSIEDILQTANTQSSVAPTAITVSSKLDRPYQIDFGRERTVFINPYSGAIKGEGSQSVRRFFRVVTDWHRWLAFGPESRAAGRAITGACNFVFLFIVLTGMYLWLPRKWGWPSLHAIIFFRGGIRGKARDFNWHNVTGFWCAIPLVIVVATAVVMSYGWANNALYLITGTQPPSADRTGPARETAQPDSRASSRPQPNTGKRDESFSPSGLNRPFAQAQTQDPSWQQITMRLPSSQNSKTVQFSIVNGLEGRPDRRAQLVLARDTGEVVRWEPFASNNAGRRLRIWFRFLHTGEAGGVVGETIAAIASAGAMFLVYTGISLAVRRFLRWRRRRKSGKKSEAETEELVLT